MKKVYISFLALVLSLSMLAGVTYSWFTDSEKFGPYTFTLEIEDTEDNTEQDDSTTRTEKEEEKGESSDDDKDEREKEDEEHKPAEFLVSIAGVCPHPVEPGEILEVAFSLENIGEEKATRQIELHWVAGETEKVEKSMEVTLEESSGKEGLKFTFEVPGDTRSEMGEVTICSEDHKDNIQVEIKETEGTGDGERIDSKNGEDELAEDCKDD